MSREPLISDTTIVSKIVTALEHNSDVVSAMMPVVRTAYCEGWREGHKSGCEDTMKAEGGHNDGGTG